MNQIYLKYLRVKCYIDCERTVKFRIVIDLQEFIYIKKFDRKVERLTCNTNFKLRSFQLLMSCILYALMRTNGSSSAQNTLMCSLPIQDCGCTLLCFKYQIIETDHTTGEVLTHQGLLHRAARCLAPSSCPSRHRTSTLAALSVRSL